MYEIVVRRGTPDNEGCYQHFTIDAEASDTVLIVLEKLNQQDMLLTTDGEKAEKIRYESNCRQGMCGACAMLVNHRPMLACKAFLRDLGTTIVLEPLSKFPLIQDLVVDRSVIHENMVKMNLWLRDENDNPQASKYLKENVGQDLYKSASCIQCGLCLEACPNYTGLDDFYGAAVMNADYRIANLESEKKEQKKQIKAAGKHFANGCSNSFACQEVCPMGIPLSLHISRLNALAWKTRR